MHFYCFYRSSCHLLWFCKWIFFFAPSSVRAAVGAHPENGRTQCDPIHCAPLCLFVCLFYGNGFFYAKFPWATFRERIDVASPNADSFAWKMCARWHNGLEANGHPTNNNFVRNEHFFPPSPNHAPATWESIRRIDRVEHSATRNKIEIDCVNHCQAPKSICSIPSDV